MTKPVKWLSIFPAKSPKHQGAQMLMAMGEMRAGNYAQSRKWVALLRTEIQARPGDHTQALNSLSELEQTINQRESPRRTGDYSQCQSHP